MNNAWSILYRGPLSSCNYACTYCPFAKTQSNRAELEDDAKKLSRFVDWVATRHDKNIGVLFTPWGEGLIRRHYRQAMIRLSRMDHVRRVAIQTNLSIKSFEWLEACDKTSLALWTTYHSTETCLDVFLQRCHSLDSMKVRYSVGVVGLKEHFDDIEAMRQRLSDSVYLWINAYKREPDYYSEQDVRRLEAIDPLFRYNIRRHPSKGASCRAGATVFSVNGEGDIQRCHFIKHNLWMPHRLRSHGSPGSLPSIWRWPPGAYSHSRSVERPRHRCASANPRPYLSIPPRGPRGMTS